MVKWSILLIALAAMVGCQSQQSVENLPQPNFNGPNVAAAPIVVPRQAPASPPVAAATPPKAPAYAGNVPREWLIPAGVPKRDWYWIVIHHSATPSGSLRDFDREHKEKGWDECGYDFVIGNGTNSGNGQIEVGPRWPKQKYGAHAKTPDNRFNEHGIGVCLVGNFDVDRPTAAQMASLTRLVKYLMVTYKIPANRVLGHRDTKPTDCPGRNFNVAVVRRAVQTQIADADAIDTQFDPTVVSDNDPAPEPVTASAELLQDVAQTETQTQTR
jgi:hypothetical protein